jgi:hypothetical protein
VIRTSRETRKELENRIATVKVLWKTYQEQEDHIGPGLVRDQEGRYLLYL